jgi:hypothetical protein
MIRCWKGKTRDRSERGRSAAVVLVREMVRATAVHLANCGEGYGRAPTQQKVHPTPPQRHFGPEKAPVVQPDLPSKLVVLRW